MKKDTATMALEVLNRISGTIERQLDLIRDRAHGAYLDKGPVVSSLKQHKKHADAAIAALEADIAQPVEPVGLRDAIAEALSSELSHGGYDCTRVWEAWQVGTMSESDFSPIGDRLDEIVETVINAIESAAPKEAAAPAWIATTLTEPGMHERVLVLTTDFDGDVLPVIAHWNGKSVGFLASGGKRVKPAAHWMPLPRSAT